VWILPAQEVPWLDVISTSDADQVAFSWSETTRSLERTIRQIAPTNLAILMVGESGTGKTFRARQIHRLSLRCNAPLKSAISSGLNSEWIEAELRLPCQGHAEPQKSCEKGTLFLKEVSELSLAAQRSLLYSIPDGDPAEAEFYTPRLICSAATDLEFEVNAGRFRRDLYYRLRGVCLHLSPLRELRNDVRLLADLLLAKHVSIQNRPQLQLTPEDYGVLQNHKWPGNIRELENLIRQMVVLNDVKAVLHELTGSSKMPDNGTKHEAQDEQHHGVALKTAAKAASRQLEEQLILEALTKTRWNRKRAALELQISYKSLLSKLKQMGGSKAG